MYACHVVGRKLWKWKRLMHAISEVLKPIVMEQKLISWFNINFVPQTKTRKASEAKCNLNIIPPVEIKLSKPSDWPLSYATVCTVPSDQCGVQLQANNGELTCTARHCYIEAVYWPEIHKRGPGRSVKRGRKKPKPVLEPGPHGKHTWRVWLKLRRSNKRGKIRPLPISEVLAERC